jgi:hypothetical protein
MGKPKYKVTSLVLDPKTKALAQELADRDGLHLSQVVTTAIQEYYAKCDRTG